VIPLTVLGALLNRTGVIASAGLSFNGLDAHREESIGDLLIESRAIVCFKFLSNQVEKVDAWSSVAGNNTTSRVYRHPYIHKSCLFSPHLHTRNFLMFVRTATIAYGQRMGQSLINSIYLY